jgi:hypothetical protein
MLVVRSRDMAEIELTDSQVERIEAIRVAALAGTTEQMQSVQRIMRTSSRRRKRLLFLEDLLAAENVLGIA